jgi:hypothetical protein
VAPGGIDKPPQRVAAGRLRLATWNIEYLIEPATYAALRDSCVQYGGRVPGQERRIPCAIVPRLDRKPQDFAALARYIRELDADVLAMQEVDGPGAANLIMTGYDYCFTSRANVQKNGFAIRRGIPFRCEPDYLPLSLGDTVRRGTVVTLFPGTRREFTLMAVHLKSGCPEGPLTRYEEYRLRDPGPATAVTRAVDRCTGQGRPQIRIAGRLQPAHIRGTGRSAGSGRPATESVGRNQ